MVCWCWPQQLWRELRHTSWLGRLVESSYSFSWVVTTVDGQRRFSGIIVKSPRIHRGFVEIMKIAHPRLETPPDHGLRDVMLTFNMLESCEKCSIWNRRPHVGTPKFRCIDLNPRLGPFGRGATICPVPPRMKCIPARSGPLVTSTAWIMVAEAINHRIPKRSVELD